MKLRDHSQTLVKGPHAKRGALQFGGLKKKVNLRWHTMPKGEGGLKGGAI